MFRTTEEKPDMVNEIPSTRQPITKGDKVRAAFVFWMLSNLCIACAGATEKTIGSAVAVTTFMLALYTIYLFKYSNQEVAPLMNSNDTTKNESGQGSTMEPLEIHTPVVDAPRMGK